ncbi:MAG: ATP-binding protein [Oligoflexales bacterium]|nr:ATP-binding protein [Oligoflexales bacterium]
MILEIDRIAGFLLLGLSALLNVDALPENADGIWRAKGGWQKSSDSYRFTAESVAIVEMCSNNPNYFVEFPSIIHGAHKVTIGGRVLINYGDMDFKVAQSFYGSPILTCKDVVDSDHSHPLIWEASSYAQYFARFDFYPRISSHKPHNKLFQETLNIVAGGGLIIIGILVLIVFWGKVGNDISISVCFAAIFLAFYFVMNVASSFGIEISMLNAHKIADAGMWIGGAFVVNVFRLQGVVGRNLLLFYIASVVLALLIFSFASTGDAVQLGTMIPFLGYFAFSLTSLIRLYVKRNFEKNNANNWFKVGTLLLFISSGINDFMIVSGVYHGYVLLSVGVVFGVIAIALDVNERINETYSERDYLRFNLEKEVKSKTLALEEKTSNLEQVVIELKTTQAELIQSAKMASLGTLSAGIAHEINNSLNYVNGAMTPLESLLKKEEQLKSNDKIFSLIKVMKEGLHITFEIIKSLRMYSGLNQAKLKEYRVAELIDAVLSILRAKIKAKNANVQIKLPENMRLTLNAAGFNQVMMNLIVNALDAMQENQAKVNMITISGQDFDDHGEIFVEDNGSGIPENILKSIFDPFFTTKDVGEGTGLGLHISRSEIKRLGGELRVSSQLGVGTVFSIIVPKNQAERVPEVKDAA